MASVTSAPNWLVCDVQTWAGARPQSSHMSQYVLVARRLGTGLCGFSRWFPPRSTLNAKTLRVAGPPGLVLPPSPCSPSPASASSGRPTSSLGVLALACVPALAGLSELEMSEGLRGGTFPLAVSPGVKGTLLPL